MNAPHEAVEHDRTKYCGGGDIASILGVSPFSTPVETWLYKRGELVREDDPILRRGRRLEPYVNAMYAEETGREVLPPVFVVGAEPWMGGSLDGMTKDGRVLEVKTAHPRTRRDWGDQGTDEIPVYYTAQVQWYLHLTGVQFADVAALIGIDDFRIYTVEADPALQRTMVDRARAFWRLVQIGVPPEIQEPHDVPLLYPRHFDGQFVEATNEDFDAVNELKSLRGQVAEIEKRSDSLAAGIQARIGSAEALTFEGRPLVTWKTQERRTIDTKALRVAMPEIAEQFERVGRSRVFRIK